MKNVSAHGEDLRMFFDPHFCDFERDEEDLASRSIGREIRNLDFNGAGSADIAA